MQFFVSSVLNAIGTLYIFIYWESLKKYSLLSINVLLSDSFVDMTHSISIKSNAVNPRSINRQIYA